MENKLENNQKNELNKNPYWGVAQKIMLRVHEICCFGSYNQPHIWDTHSKFLLLLKAVHVILSKENLQAKIIRESSNENIAANVKKIKASGLKLLWTSSDNMCFKRGEMIFKLTPEYLFIHSAEVIEVIKVLYPSDKFKWNVSDLQYLKADIAFYLLDWVEDPREVQRFLENDFSYFKRQNYLGDYYNKGIEPKIKKDRDDFIKFTIQSVKEKALMYGCGNCALMADAAFLEAINMKTPVSYIRFISTQDAKIEELNCIVLGNWPQPGCLIVSPWQNDKNTPELKGRIYEWRGSVHETPEITAHNEVRTLFKLTTVNELDKFYQTLQKFEYASWLDNSERKDNLAKIESFAEGLKQGLIEQNFVLDVGQLQTTNVNISAC